MRTIVALSSAPMRSAIAVVRLSGAKTKSILAHIFDKPTPPRKMVYGSLDFGEFHDSAMLAFFAAPHTFTGEDMAEFYIHGSPILWDALIKQCIKYGAEYARAGEFAATAFVNGKLDLTQAEGIIDLIDSKSLAEAQAAAQAANGQIFTKIHQLLEQLLHARASWDAVLDYPEEDIEVLEGHQLLQIIVPIEQEICELTKNFDTNKLLREGVRVAILGQVNAGKSSLFNALLQQDRAIVSEFCGTTRDTVEQEFVFNNVRFVLVDTAGFNQHAQEVEALGIKRTHDEANKCDFALFLSQTDDIDIEECALPASKILKIRSKCDQIDYEPSGFDACVSAKTGQNLSMLKQLMYQKAFGHEFKQGQLMVCNARHFGLLCAARNALLSAIRLIECGGMADLIALELGSAWRNLQDIVGEGSEDELVNAIFARFCVGK